MMPPLIKASLISTEKQNEVPPYVPPERTGLSLSKPAAWASGWTSAVLRFSAATEYWLAGEHKRAICWGTLGAVEVAAIVL